MLSTNVTQPVCIQRISYLNVFTRTNAVRGSFIIICSPKINKHWYFWGLKSAGESYSRQQEDLPLHETGYHERVQKDSKGFALSNAVNWICDNAHKKFSVFPGSTFLQLLASILTAKLGNKLSGLNKTTNFKWLHTFFINKDLRKDVEYSNVGFAQMMQIWERNKPLDSDISVTPLLCSIFCPSLGLRNTIRSAPVFLVNHFCQRYLDMFEQRLLRWIADVLLSGAVEQAEVYIWNRAGTGQLSMAVRMLVQNQQKLSWQLTVLYQGFVVVEVCVRKSHQM